MNYKSNLRQVEWILFFYMSWNCFYFLVDLKVCILFKFLFPPCSYDYAHRCSIITVSGLILKIAAQKVTTYLGKELLELSVMRLEFLTS